MAFPPRYGSVTDSGDFDGDTAGTVNAGTTLNTRDIEPGSLSVYANVTATTNTLTISVLWQVSNDASTWIRLTPVNNAADVALATGTGSGVDGDKVYPCPECVFGWKYVRAAATNGAATGGATDTYALTTRWVKRSAF